MKTLKELEQEYNKKKDQYETALTAVAHAGSNKVEVQRAAAILDISYDECQKAYTEWQEAVNNAQCTMVFWRCVRWNDGVMCVVLVCDGSTRR